IPPTALLRSVRSSTRAVRAVTLSTWPTAPWAFTTGRPGRRPSTAPRLMVTAENHWLCERAITRAATNSRSSRWLTPASSRSRSFSRRTCSSSLNWPWSRATSSRSARFSSCSRPTEATVSTVSSTQRAAAESAACTGATASRSQRSGRLTAALGSDVTYDKPASARKSATTARACHSPGFTSPTSCVSYASLVEAPGADQHPLHHVEVLQGDAGAHRHRAQGVLRHVHRHPRLLGQEPVQSVEQRAAPGHENPLLDDVRRELGRGPLQRDADRFDDGLDRLG